MGRAGVNATFIYLVVLLLLVVCWLLFPHSAVDPERHPLQRAIASGLAHVANR